MHGGRATPLYHVTRPDTCLTGSWNPWNRMARNVFDPMLVVRGGYNRSELNTIAALIQEPRDRLLESWHGFFGR